jgi:hypothetical protein
LRNIDDTTGRSPGPAKVRGSLIELPVINSENGTCSVILFVPFSSQAETMAASHDVSSAGFSRAYRCPGRRASAPRFSTSSMRDLFSPARFRAFFWNRTEMDAKLLGAQLQERNDVR